MCSHIFSALKIHRRFSRRLKRPSVDRIRPSSFAYHRYKGDKLIREGNVERARALASRKYFCKFDYDYDSPSSQLGKGFTDDLALTVRSLDRAFHGNVLDYHGLHLQRAHIDKLRLGARYGVPI